jgi:hypothetical protein
MRNKIRRSVIAAATMLGLSAGAQDLYLKYESRTEGLPLVGKMAKNITEIWCTTNERKSEMTMMNATQTELVSPDKVIITNTKPKSCAFITRQDLVSDSLDANGNYQNVNVMLTNDEKVILGYKCKKAIITYVVSSVGTYAYELIIWYTSELQYPASDKLPEYRKKDAYTNALMSLKGIALETETIMKSNNVRVYSNATSVSTKPINSSVFNADMNLCKKPMNLQEYKEYQRKLARQAYGY